MIDYSRRILELDDTQLEKFVYAWVNRKKATYFRVEKFTGTGDMGRDVVGFATKDLHEGDWDNYQCKQYGTKLGTGTVMLELGKVLYHSFRKQFTTPRKELFVAPRGVNRNLVRLFNSPSQFRVELLANWAKHCEHGITESTPVPLTPELTAHIEAYDFSTAQHISLDAMLVDNDIKPVLHEFFGADPGPPPKGVIPVSVDQSELPYINKLVEAYGERNGGAFQDYQEVESHQEYGPHLYRQRERFHDADAFLRFYRDNTSKETIDEFTKDIFHGVIDVNSATHTDSLACVDAVMSQAAVVQPAGPLAGYAKVPVKQGVCHHFANEDKLKWKK